jgi:glycerol-3-phosphate acyltransferase PlsX
MTGRKNYSELPIAVDVMGGDNGPLVVIRGAVQAANELGISSTLVGDKATIEEALATLKLNDESLIAVHHASDVFTMEDVPSRAIRTKPDASMRVAFELVKKGEASGIVSAGNTGVMMAVGLFVSGVMPGIARPAIATLVPKVGEALPTVLVDSGANVDCAASQLVQFALMGDVYARAAISCERPRVALLSNGSEKSKGCDVTRAAAATLSQMEMIHYVGYIEGRDLPRDVVDVVVCDGFVGNIVLKTMEGSVELVIDSMRSLIEKDWKAKLGMWLAKPIFKKLFNEKLDPSAYGGAPLLGLNDIGIVCHGSSNEKAIFNAVRVARKLAEEGLIDHMKGALSVVEVAETAGGYDDGMWNRLGHRFDPRKKGKSKPASPVESEETKIPAADNLAVADKE